MPAYIVVIREKTRDSSSFDEYKKLAPLSCQNHPVKFLALHGRHEVLEGPQSEEIIILEFPNYEAAQAGITAPNIKLRPSIAIRPPTTALSSPKASRPSSRQPCITPY